MLSLLKSIMGLSTTTQDVEFMLSDSIKEATNDWLRYHWEVMFGTKHMWKYTSIVSDRIRTVKKEYLDLNKKLTAEGKKLSVDQEKEIIKKIRRARYNQGSTMLLASEEKDKDGKITIKPKLVAVFDDEIQAQEWLDVRAGRLPTKFQPDPTSSNSIYFSQEMLKLAEQAPSRLEKSDFDMKREFNELQKRAAESDEAIEPKVDKSVLGDKEKMQNAGLAVKDIQFDSDGVNPGQVYVLDSNGEKVYFDWDISWGLSPEFSTLLTVTKIKELIEDFTWDTKKIDPELELEISEAVLAQFFLDTGFKMYSDHPEKLNERLHLGQIDDIFDSVRRGIQIVDFIQNLDGVEKLNGK